MLLFEPTYEELKAIRSASEIAEKWGLSLPMRNWKKVVALLQTLRYPSLSLPMRNWKDVEKELSDNSF